MNPNFRNFALWVVIFLLVLALVTLTFLEIILGVDNVIFISILSGKLPEAEQARARRTGLLAAMDMAVLPSAGDYTSPVKLFEFMACGIPPVAPDFAPIREVLAEGRTGWMFKAHDLESAVTNVLSRSTDLDELRRVGAAARAYIAAERQWRNNVEQLVEFHLQLKNSDTHAAAGRPAC